MGFQQQLRKGDHLKRRTAPEIIATHLGWNITDVSDGIYQHYTPTVYVCGNDYYCCPPKSNGRLPNIKGHGETTPWKKVGTYFERDVYEYIPEKE